MSRNVVEDVLLAMPEVKYKKSDGTLYVMKSKVAFVVDNRETVLITHSFFDVKSKSNFQGFATRW